MDVYDQVLGFDESDLGEDIKMKLSSVFVPGVRGFGYWSWKPYFVLRALKESEPGDIVHWADAGCWLRREGRSRLLEYFRIVDQAPSGLLGFQAFRVAGEDLCTEKFSLPEKQWSKGDLLDYLNVRNNSNILNSNQIEATTFFVKNDPVAVAVIEQWMSVFFRSLALVDDTPSKSPNEPGFIEHRHDQSVFSILMKINGATTLSAFETYCPIIKAGKPHWAYDFNWSVLESFPIWAKREKDRGLVGKITHYIMRAWAKALAILRVREYKRPW
jgi:hypothetical protein